MKKIFLVALVGLTILFLAPNLVQAALVPCGGEGQPSCQLCHIFVLFDDIITYVLTILTPIIAGLMLVVGGFYMLFAGPSPQLFDKGKSIIKGTVVGLVIIMISWVLLNTVFTYIGVKEWTGLETWWQINCVY